MLRKKILLLILFFSISFSAFSQVNYKEIKNYSVEVLYEKMRAGNSDVINAVKLKKINLNKENVLGYTVLTYACLDNEIELVEILLKAGAKPNEGVNFPLYEVCWASEKPKNQSEIIKLLVRYGADVNKQYKNTKDTPLHATIKKQGGRYASLLISLGAKINVENSEKETPLMLAVDYYSKLIDSALVQKLINLGADVNAISKKGNTALSIAAYNGRTDIVRMLLNNGATVSVNKKNKNEIPILNACFSGELDCVNLLLQYGADITLKDSYGSSALILSCISKDNPELVELCIQNGCDVNYVDPSSGYTPFILAAIWNHPEQMKVLYKAGANINAENPEIGNTLMFIVANGIKEPNPPYYPANELGGAICGIELGMNLKGRNSRGETLRSLVVKYLNKSNNPDKINDYKKILDLIAIKENRKPIIYSLHEAVILNKVDVVKLILKDENINVNDLDNEGNTPLYYARKFNYTEIEKLLVSKKAVE